MPKKHLGQNFLKSIKHINEVIIASKIEESDYVLEIGPGKGALTKKLLEKAKMVIAIEKDRDLIPFLEEKFHDDLQDGKLKIEEADVLDFELAKLPKKYKLVANIPFYITGAIIEKFLESKNQPSLMTLIVQKEVADRIVARDEKESILSLSVKVFGEPKYIGKIPARYFSPPPKVDSAIISIEKIKTKLSDEDLSKFFKLVKAGFSQKRKTLIKNLSNTGISKDILRDNLLNMGLDENIRAEDLKIKDWISLISLI